MGSMFRPIGDKIIAVKQKQGYLKFVADDVLDQMAEDYAERVENYLTRALVEHSEKHGRLDELEHLLDTGGDVPGFAERLPGWGKRQEEALNEIIGEITGIS